MPHNPLDYASPATPSTGMPRWVLWLVALLCIAAIGSIYYGRIVIGPPDLYRKDQCKTMAYTVDMVLNHRFSLPRDVIFQPATKPPLYNWFAAAGVWITGSFNEYVQKWPSILSALAVAGLVFAFCRRHYAQVIESHYALCLGLFAAAIWICTKATVLLVYIARPDMLQALCLIGAWAAANEALGCESRRAARKWAVWYWLATTAAALAKGPAAVYPILYALLAARLIFGGWRKTTHLYWLIGLPIMLASVGLWLLCAYLQDAQHVTGVLLGTEVYKRIASSNPEGFVKPWYYAVQWWTSQNAYWSWLAIGSMVVGLLGSIRRLFVPTEIRRAEANSPYLAAGGGGGFATDSFVDANSPLVSPPNLARKGGGVSDRLRLLATRFFDRIGICDGDGLFTGPAGMATLWVLVVVGCLSIPADKRQDFLLPAHPASAILAANFVIFLISRFEWTRYALPMFAACLLLWEKKSVPDAHVAIVAGLFLVLVAGISLARKNAQRFLPYVALGAAIAFFAFEVKTNTRFGSYKTSPSITLIAFFAGGAAVAAMAIAAFPRFRLELPLVAGGIIFWGYALLQNNYRDTGLPNSTNPSLYAMRFANEARKIVGDDKVISIFRSKHPILILMGRHQGSYLTRKDFEDAKWVIVERSKFPALMDSEQEKLFSGKIDVEFGHIKELGHKIMKDRVSLIRIDKERNSPSVDELIAIHLWVQDWTTDDANPYRSPGTGWVELPGTKTPPEWTPPPGDPWYERDKLHDAPLDETGEPADQ